MTGQMVWDLFGVPANSATSDADGCRWTVASSDGWDAPDQRTQYGTPTGRHGQYGFNRYADGRPVVIKGLIFAPSQTVAWQAYDRVVSSMPGLLGSGVITANEPVPKSLTVTQAAPPRVSKPAEDGTMTYWLTLTAEYPWKRALTPITVSIPAGDTVTVTHSGTFAAEFTATTTSSGTVRLASAGLQLECASVPSGTVFDSQEFTVTDSGGTDLYGLIEPGSEWPAVSVGAVDWINAGTADVELSYFPTYA